jgi:hypothetical protein
MNNTDYLGISNWFGLFDRLEPDPVGVMLGTGMLRFESPFGVSGLVRPGKNKLEFLAVESHVEGKGHFRLFIEQAQARCNEVYVWHDWNPIIGQALARYGFERATQREPDGEVLTGWGWKEPEEIHG